MHPLFRNVSVDEDFEEYVLERHCLVDEGSRLFVSFLFVSFLLALPWHGSPVNLFVDRRMQL